MIHHRPIMSSLTSLTKLRKAHMREVSVGVNGHLLKSSRCNTLSESRSGSAWHRRYRNDFGSLHSVCLVVRKYVPPTFRRTHLDEPLPDGCSLSPGERAGHLRPFEPLGSGLFSAIPPLRSRCLTDWWDWARAGSVQSLKAAVCPEPSLYRLPLQTHRAAYLDRTFTTQEYCNHETVMLLFFLARQLNTLWHTATGFYWNCSDFYSLQDFFFFLLLRN